MVGHRRRRGVALAAIVVAGALAAGCGGGGSADSGGSTSAGSAQRGGNLIFSRPSDSTSMNQFNVFNNDSIWVFEQITEPLYTVTANGKNVKPWLATSYDLSSDGMTYTFHLRKGVKFSNGQPMTSADVKFTLDQARTTKGGWEFIDVAIKDVQAPDPNTVVVHTKYKWAPFLADIALFSNAIIPKDFAGQSEDEFFKHPIGTGPFVWDHWNKGQEVVLKRNPNYWQKGKPYLDQVTFSLVPDDNTRILQLKGGQSDINQFPPFSALQTLKGTPGVVMKLFPSTRTDYIEMNQRRKPFDDVHVRRAISYAIDRESIIKSVQFGIGKPANSFMPPQVPYYDPQSPGLQYDLNKAKQEMAQSSVPNGFKTTMLAGAGIETETSQAEIIQQSLKKIGIDLTIKKVDQTTEADLEDTFNYDMGPSYWTMDIADPDELVTFAVDPGAGAHSFYTDYNNPQVVQWTHEAQRTFDPAKRAQLYKQIQAQSAQDAFMIFLYYTPYRYAFSDKVHDFLVYPTGNFHLEDVWLSK
jgi:peptide/nickel transport system substrate-binding protein